MTLGALSAVVGAAMALAQDDLKRLLAFDTVSQMGILTIGFATASPAGIAGATYHLLNHGLFKALMFLCAGTIVHATGQTELSQMGGLARRRPLLTAGFSIGVLAIAGIPPLNGYASLGLIHQSLEESHQWVPLAAALLAQVLTIAALVRAAWLGFYRRRPTPYEHLERARPGMTVVLITLGAGCIGFGVLPGLIITHVVSPAAAALTHPDSYAAGVLTGQASLPTVTIGFSYFTMTDLAITVATIVVGVALAIWYLRKPEPRPITALRNLHTGSVNDYAAAAAAGIIACTLTALL